MSTVPCNFLVLSLSRLHQQALIVHLMHVSSPLHVDQDVFLEFRDRLKGVWYVLILLDIADYLCCFCSFGEIDKIGPFDD